MNLCLKRSWLPGLLAGALLLTTASAEDWQSWNGLKISRQLRPELSVFYQPQVRWRDHADDFYYHEHRLGFRRKECKHFSWGLNYLYGRSQSAASGNWLDEHRGELDFVPRTVLGPFILSFRGRLELRSLQSKPGDVWRGRIMPKLAYPLKFGEHAFTPYLAHDWFYDFENDFWNQNRLYAGSVFPLGRIKDASLKLNLFYMLQSQRKTGGDWGSKHILGSSLAIQVD